MMFNWNIKDKQELTRLISSIAIRKWYEAKIDNVAALLDAFVAYKLNKEAFE